MEMRDHGAIASFLSGLNDHVILARRLQQKANRIAGFEFTSFTFIDVDEQKLSNIMSSLLDPDGAHGQGDMFLRALMRTLHIPERGHSPGFSIKTEDYTRYIKRYRRRVDIRVRWKDFVLAIENKPWASDQPSQIEDYVKDCQFDVGDRFLILYLSKEGSDPTPDSISPELCSALKVAGRLRSVRYSADICTWIQDCIRLCEADKVRWFLRDLSRFIDEELSSIVKE